MSAGILTTALAQQTMVALSPMVRMRTRSFGLALPPECYDLSTRARSQLSAASRRGPWLLVISGTELYSMAVPLGLFMCQQTAARPLPRVGRWGVRPRWLILLPIQRLRERYMFPPIWAFSSPQITDPASLNYLLQLRLPSRSLSAFPRQVRPGTFTLLETVPMGISFMLPRMTVRRGLISRAAKALVRSRAANLLAAQTQQVRYMSGLEWAEGCITPRAH